MCGVAGRDRGGQGRGAAGAAACRLRISASLARGAARARGRKHAADARTQGPRRDAPAADRPSLPDGGGRHSQPRGPRRRHELRSASRRLVRAACAGNSARTGHRRRDAGLATRRACWGWRGRRSSLSKPPPRRGHGSRRRGGAGRSPAGPFARRSSKKPFRIGSTRLSGRAMADHDPVEARIADSFAAVDAATWDRLRGHVRPVPEPRLLRRAGRNRAASAAHSGWTPLPLLVEPGRKAGRRRAGFSQDPQPGRICVRPGLGRRLAAGRRRLLSQAADRGAVHAGGRAAAPRRGSGACACSGRDGGPAERACRRRTSPSSPPTRPPRPRSADGWSATGCSFTGTARGERDFDGFLERCSSRKRKVIRKERAAAREGLSFRHLRGAEIGARRDGRDVALLPGHRQPQMGPAPISPARFFRLRRSSGSATSCCCSSPSATASRSPARSTGSAPTRSTAATGAAARRCRSSTSSFAITRRSTGRSLNGLTTVQAGAQGEHKLARGYEPVLTLQRALHPARRLPRGSRRIPPSRSARRSPTSSKRCAPNCRSAKD